MKINEPFCNNGVCSSPVKMEHTYALPSDNEVQTIFIDNQRKRRHESPTSDGTCSTPSCGKNAKRIKEEHLHNIKKDKKTSLTPLLPTNPDAKVECHDCKMDDTVVKPEENGEADMINHVKIENGYDHLPSYENALVKTATTATPQTRKKTEDSGKPSKPSSLPPINKSDAVPLAFYDALICCNCEQYKIMTKSDLILHSKFHKNILPLQDFNQFSILVQKIRYGKGPTTVSPIKGDEEKSPTNVPDASPWSSNSTRPVNIKQTSILQFLKAAPPPTSPSKLPKRSPAKSSATNEKKVPQSPKKWDNRPAAKVVKTLHKDPYPLVHKVQILLRKLKQVTKHKAIPEMLTSFILFVRERHLIWIRRNLQNLPRKQWTENKILKEHWFTNIYRELDRGTAFLKRNLHETVFRSRNLEPIHGPNSIRILKRILLKCFSYRLVNRLDTFLEFGKLPDIGDYQDWVKFLRYKYQLNKEGGEKSIIFTRAHQNNGLERYFETMEYVKSNLSSMAQDLQNAAERRQVKQCFFIIKDVPGAGKFMSWQILCDLLELRQLGDCTDNQWTCLGPGARNGLRRIFREVKEKDELFLTRVLRDLCQAQGTTSAYQVLDLDPPTFLGKEVSLKNIEHALCEYDKYVRFAMGQGVRQRRFNETTSSAHYDKLTQKCPECFKNISICSRRQSAKPKCLKERLCPLCKRLYHDGCTTEEHKEHVSHMCSNREDEGHDGATWICPSCLPFVDLWQKEDYHYEEPASISSRSPKKCVTKSQKTRNAKEEKTNITISSGPPQNKKNIFTIILSDSDDSDYGEEEEEAKQSNQMDVNYENSSTQSEDDMEEGKENVLNKILNGDCSVDLVDETEHNLKDRICALPLF